MSRKITIVLLAVMIALFSIAAITPPIGEKPGPKARLDPRFLTDEFGRVFNVRGVNLSNASKSAPNRIPWHTYADYARLRTWGFNTIRLLIFWDAIEPNPGEFNAEYLNLVAERVGWARELGLKIILDMHQDLYSSKYGADGAPLWACDDDGIEYTIENPWWINYIDPAVMTAFKNFWANDQLNQHFIDSWVQVAKKFKGDSTILGFDLFNEPFFTYYGPAEFERKVLSSFYNRLIPAIQTEDPSRRCFVEPEITTSSGVPSVLPKLPFANIGYMPHYYHPLIHEGKPYNGDPLPLLEALNLKEQESKRLAAPWILGEFGVSDAVENFGQYLDDILGILDDKMAGWTVYSYDRSGDDGGFGIITNDYSERATLNYLVRPYPLAIAGTPVKYGFNRKQLSFTLLFKTDTPQSLATEIFIPKTRLYPNGFTVTMSDASTSSWNDERQILSIQADPKSTLHRIEIKPKP